MLRLANADRVKHLSILRGVGVGWQLYTGVNRRQIDQLLLLCVLYSHNRAHIMHCYRQD